MTALMPMSTIENFTGQEQHIDEAELAAAAFLARYHGRTLDAYRYDLRAFFQWAAEDRLDILKATRPQIELYMRAMGVPWPRGDHYHRRLSTVCGFYRFAHIDGRIASNPAQYVRRPRSTPTTPVASIALSSAGSCLRPSGSTTPTPPWPCSWAQRPAGE